MKQMEYKQVKDRVEREDRALKKLVPGMGFGMLIAVLLASFLFR